MKVKRAVPNCLSCIRLLVSPFVCLSAIQEHWTIAFLLIIYCGVSDAIDGEFARKWKAITKFGKIIDPVADLAYSLSTLAGLFVTHKAPMWFTQLVVCYGVVVLSRVVFGKRTKVRKIAGCIAMPLWLVLLSFLIFQYGIAGGVTSWLLVYLELAAYSVFTVWKWQRLMNWVRSR
jgi:phosphatidylglycerophosphate synthase